MLCRLCETFLTNILHQEFSTWKRVEQGWFTFKYAEYATLQAAAEAGCETCRLFNDVRENEIPNYAQLGLKWHALPASIDVKYDTGVSGTGVDRFTPRWSFQLLTVGPEMSWLPFELYHPDSEKKLPSDAALPTIELTQAISKRADLSPSIAIAKSWIDQCIGHHQSCRRSKRSPLPTRVIDVGQAKDSPTPKLQINKGQLGQYVTLSHCWGNGSRVTLTKENLPTFKDAIPFEKLPETFQDAIRFTILLGVQYLWVDALCIVQDDREDWAKESTSMCSIFENALFSLSALSAVDSYSGLVQDRTTAETTVDIEGIRLGVRTRLPSLSEALQKSRLETRAWCFQERLLARAILHVGPEQMYWECSSRTFMESQPETNGRHEEQRKSPGNLQNRLKSSSHAFDHSFWLRLVAEYSARRITKPTDRLPAIAGLAFRETHNRVYMQGLWSGEEHIGLMWRRQKLMHAKVVPSRDKYFSRTSSRNTARPSETIASSWSWASINDAVEFPLCNTFTVREVTPSDASFESAGGSLAFGRPFAGLNVCGVLKRGACKQSGATQDQAIFRSSGSTLSDEGISCVVDYPDEPVSRGCYCLRIATWSPADTKSGKRQRAAMEKASYLMLEKVGGGERPSSSDGHAKFRRIGMGYDSVAKVDRLFLNADRRDLVII